MNKIDQALFKALKEQLQLAEDGKELFKKLYLKQDEVNQKLRKYIKKLRSTFPKNKL